MKKCQICGEENKDNAKFCNACGSSLIKEPGIGYRLNVGAKIGNRYTIGKILGEGGFGITYKGSDSTFNREVAIKEFFYTGSGRRGNTVIPPQMLKRKDFEEMKEKFRKEADVLSRISSENVVTVFDYIEENNTGYIVMEYVSGETLKQKIQREKRIETAEIKKIILQLLKGLKEVHREDLLHRDIKPENIMLDAEKLKLLDFGATREYALGKSMDMSQIITHGYAPPEQYIDRGKYGPELDIYAVGATMYEMVTGKIPPNAIERMKDGEELEELDYVSLDEDLKAIIIKSLSLNSKERYPIVEDLERAMRKEKVEISEPSNDSGKSDKHSRPQNLKMIKVEGGTFAMGDALLRYKHEVEISYDFWIGKYPITFEEYDKYCGEKGIARVNDDYYWGRGSRPVINVSWYDAIHYCNWLSEKEGFSPAYAVTGIMKDRKRRVADSFSTVEGYRLLTEAEWEYAAKGGLNSYGFVYSGGNYLDDVGWYEMNSLDKYDGDQKTYKVGIKKPNELGIYDMSGNIWEWCQDWYDEDFYQRSRKKDPVNVNRFSSSYCVLRGGCWYDNAKSCQVTYRYRNSPNSKGYGIGFRIARTII